MIFITHKNNIALFWKIGKNVYELEGYYDNMAAKCSTYLSYYYGNSYLYTTENIKYMKKLYLSFPIYNKKMEIFSWEQYKLLLKLKNSKEKYFYFYISLLFNSDYRETENFINNDYYYRI